MKYGSVAVDKLSGSLLRILAIAVVAFSVITLCGCDDGGSSTYSGASTAEEEASHYYYDSEGHIHDDRD